MGTPYIYIYTTTGFGPRKNKKIDGVYHVLVYVQTVVFWGSLHVHQEMAYTSHFLNFSRPKPGGGVYIYIWCHHNMGPKKKIECRTKKHQIHADANAENTGGPHDESPPYWVWLRRPPHIMWPAGICSICLRVYFLPLPHIVFSAFGPYCISGPTGATNQCVFSFPLDLTK